MMLLGWLLHGAVRPKTLRNAPSTKC